MKGSLVHIIAAAAGAALSGYWMWRHTTRSMYYRSPNSSIRPPDVTEEDYEGWVIARRKRWRAAKSALAAGLGAVVAWLLCAMILSGFKQG